MSTALLALAWTVAAIWTWLAVRSFRGLGSVRMLRPDGEGPGADPPRIDVVAPAHDEEREVEASMRSILAQDYPDFRLFAVDDQSTDATPAILEQVAATDRRMIVVRGVERPTGWVGKTWAVQQGFDRSDADWVAFVDADMELHPEALAVAVRVARESNADLVSLLPRPICRTFWQSVVAPTLGLLLAQLYPLGRVNDPSRAEALAAGGFILVRRSAYLQAGGHEAVRSEIVEDINLARRFKALGARLAVHPAGDLARTHMYGTFGEIWRGLRKNFYAGMEYQPHKFVTTLLVVPIFAWTPIIAIIAGIATGSIALTAAGGCGWLGQAAAALPIIVFARIPWLYAFGLPVGMSAYLAIGCSSVWHHSRGRVIWKGRHIERSLVDPVRGPSR